MPVESDLPQKYSPVESHLPVESDLEEGTSSKGCLKCLIDFFTTFRAVESNRMAWKLLCSLLLIGEFAVYFYCIPSNSMLSLGTIGTFFVVKSLVEIWGQETPTWICPGSVCLLIIIFGMIIPSVVYLNAYCTKTCDIGIPYRDYVGMLLYFFGSGYSLCYEVGRFQWKAKPENKGRLHTIGLAKFCIHPNYFGDLFTYTGWAVAAGTQCALSVPTLMLFTFWLLVIPSSDAYLANRYPDEFPAYLEKTGTLIPFLRSPLAFKILAWASLALSIYLSTLCTQPCGL